MFQRQLLASALSRATRTSIRTVPASVRTYASTAELRRPAGPLRQSDLVVESFSGPSRPRAYYARPGPAMDRERDLPPLQRKWPILLLTALLGTTSWALFYLYAANQERLSSSVFQRVLGSLKDSQEVQDVFGQGIRPEPVWWMNGDPLVNGAVYLLQGNVDLSFRIKGHKNAGTVYFTSIRKAKGEPFTILRFRVIADDGKVVEVSTSTMQY